MTTKQMPIDVKNCLTCEWKCDIFKSLTDKELELVNSNRSEARFKSGELIMKQGAPSNMVIFAVKGLVKLFIEGIERKDMILAIVKPPQFISGPELFYNKIYNYSASALTNVDCCYVDENIFKQLINNNRIFSDSFLSEFCRRSINTMNLLVNSTQKKMNGRIADGLIYLSKIFENDEFEMLLSKKEFGDMTTMTRESTIRILHQFKEDGIIESKGNKIKILDKRKLISISVTG